MDFIKALGFAFVVVLLSAGLLYWVFKFFKRIFKDFGFFVKYKILKKKYKEDEVKRLMEYLDAGLSKDEVHKFLLLNGIDKKRIKELLYIYKQMKFIKLKGGDDNGKQGS